MFDLATYAPLMLAIGVLLLQFHVFGSGSRYGRAFAAVTCILGLLRYLYWRILYSLPIHERPIERIWTWSFLAVECGAVLSSIFVHLFLARHIDRSAIADERQRSPLLDAPVDVFIVTYNESRAILERTLIGATAIDHRDLRVWVLDDGGRPWVKDLAAIYGAEYRCRVKGKHAKAGNVNNGLRHALTIGRKPEFILLLDADFIASGRILKRTLGLFEEEDVGIVQTPQHFFNQDPVQRNLVCASAWPDEQRFFFNTLMPSKDAWGVAFCCGTSAVLRVRALEANGGMATETVTEDMLTSLQMAERGYRTIFLNEPLSLGLAPESLAEYLSQRSRWCLGAMQQVYTRWSFCGSARISFMNRIAFLDTVLYWVAGAPFRLMVLCAPMVYWLTGATAIRADLPDLLYWMAPMLAANALFMHFYSGNRVLPVITDVTQLLSSFVICRTVATALLRPFGHPFKVTAKGLAKHDVTVHWSLLWRFLAIAALTILGILLQSSTYRMQHGTPGYALAMLWSVFNIAVLLLACVGCVELPQRRQDERFRLSEEALLTTDTGAEIGCRLVDLSLSGAQLRVDATFSGAIAAVRMDHGRITARCEQVRLDQSTLTVRFVLDPALRRELILKLFTGRYDNSVETISATKVFRALAKTLTA